jgi:predicted Zn-dependent peptidase
MELGSMFEIVATAREGKSADELLKVIDEELVKLRTNGVQDAELARAKTSFTTDIIFDMERSSARANRLNNYVHYTGNADYLATDLGKTNAATTTTVANAARTWLKEKERVVTLVQPKVGAPIAGKATKITRSAPASGGVK